LVNRRFLLYDELVSPVTYVIFYDGTCALCQSTRRYLESLETKAMLRFVDSRDPKAMAEFPRVGSAETEGQMFVVAPGGKSAGGYDGLMLLLPALRKYAWMATVLRHRPFTWLGRVLYRFIARHRHRLFGTTAAPACDGDTCRVG
jgi:predicted DCC family thiol-disulfide oxidoreductase YuxK